jgi:hypothetical protein
VTRVRKLLIVLLAMGVVGLVSGMGAYSMFSASTSNSGDAFRAGTVYLTDNDSGNAMLSLSSAMPGTSSTGCIWVQYQGTLDSTVRLYASVSGNLAQYLDLRVTRGTDSSNPPPPAATSCTNFAADSTTYISGQNPGVIYHDLLSNYATDYSGGLVDPKSATPETWSTGETHSYLFVITLSSGVSANAQGQSATATFTWEARNQ